jgi:Bacteriocin-protection, YdeI or OmpD-Associated/Domain of unknown function (DUF1905)
MRLEKFDSGMHYVLIPMDFVPNFIANGAKRATCTINHNVDFHCAFMPKKEGGFFINIGSKICKELNLKVGDEVDVQFKPDTTEFQFEMPEEFAEVLYQEPDALAIFDGLTDGNKRGLMYLVTMVKSSEKRIEKALKIVEKLKLGITSPRLIMK